MLVIVEPMYHGTISALGFVQLSQCWFHPVKCPDKMDWNTGLSAKQGHCRNHASTFQLGIIWKQQSNKTKRFRRQSTWSIFGLCGPTIKGQVRWTYRCCPPDHTWAWSQSSQWEPSHQTAELIWSVKYGSVWSLWTAPAGHWLLGEWLIEDSNCNNT